MTVRHVARDSGCLWPRSLGSLFFPNVLTAKALAFFPAPDVLTKKGFAFFLRVDVSTQQRLSRSSCGARMIPSNTSRDKGVKRSRSADAVVMAPRCMQGIESLNANGAMTFCTGIDATHCVAQLRECCNTWFHQNLAKMLTDPGTTMIDPDRFPEIRGEAAWSTLTHKEQQHHTRKIRLWRSKARWDALDPTEQQAVVHRIDLRTDEGMRLAFDARYITTLRWWEQLPGNHFLREAIIYVKQGNVAMGLSNMACSWASNGFGLWAHLVPDAGLPLLEAAMRCMGDELGLEVGAPQHFPHVIYKPPGGAALGTHHDQMSPRDLLKHLRQHVASADPSTLGWVQRHGCQMLTHLQGGTGTQDGATYVVGPLTPRTLLLCLEAFSEGRCGGDHSSWNCKGLGPITLDWKAHLECFNALLRERGEQPVGLLPISPSDADARGGFTVCFPVGWPHGSFQNHLTENPREHKGSRITITLPVSMRGSSQDPDPRIPERLRAMATLSTGGRTAAEYAAAETFLLRDTNPYAGGRTHCHPERVGDLIRHPDAPGPTGPFWPVSVKEATLSAHGMHLRGVSRGSAQVAPVSRSDTNTLAKPIASPAAVPAAKARPSRVPPDVAVLDEDVRIFKVKQPWALMLVQGVKDVENRSTFLKPKTGFPVWVLVASSKQKPTADTLHELQCRLERSGQTDLDHALSMRYQHIIGMVKLAGCYSSPPVPSVWHNAGDVAWVISDAWQFGTPVPLDADDGMQTQASLSTRPQYRARIEEEMRKLCM